MDSLRLEIRQSRTTPFLEIVWIDPRTANSQIVGQTPTAITSERLGAIRGELGRVLQEAKDVLGPDLTPSWQEIDAATRTLWRAGNLLLRRLFPFNGRKLLGEWQNYFTPIFESSPTPPAVTIIDSFPEPQKAFSNYLIPLEFLPLFRQVNNSPVKWKTIRSSEDLERILKNFVGYRCVVNRALGVIGELRSDKTIPKKTFHRPKKTSALSAKLFVCRTLEGARNEVNRLKGTKNIKMDLDIWPRLRPAGTAADLAEFLWKTTHCTKRKKRLRPDQIHHFATHFDTRNLYPDQHFITLAPSMDEESAFKIKMHQLEAELQEWKLSAAAIPERGKRPMVFANSCGSSYIDPSGVTSLPSLFLQLLESRAFVGVETTVSDSVAPEFAIEFYTRLLLGASVGRAVYDSKRALVARFNNPLGIFYTCYAHSTLKIQ